jgi:hypothetical protein
MKRNKFCLSLLWEGYETLSIVPAQESWRQPGMRDREVMGSEKGREGLEANWG